MLASRLLEYILYPPRRVNKLKLARHLSGKTVLITGASSGIGEQLAYLLGEMEVHLVLVARRADKLSAIKATLMKEGSQSQVDVFPADLRNEEEMQRLLLFLHQLPNGLDIVISNAGHSIKRSIYESLDRYHDYTRTMSINYFAPVQLLLSTIPLLEQKKGQIINVSTINALLYPFPHWAAYQASKTAFDTWLRSVAPELAVKGIAAASVYLPLVRTPMIAPTAAYQHAPAMSAQHAARIIGHSIYTGKRSYKPWWLLYGQLGSILFRGLWDRIIPSMIRRREKRHENV